MKYKYKQFANKDDFLPSKKMRRKHLPKSKENPQNGRKSLPVIH
jgi:hypothetical protein